MGILSSTNYPARTSSSSSTQYATVKAKQTYKVNFVTNTGNKATVYSGGTTTVSSTYKIPKKSTTTIGNSTSTATTKTASTASSNAYRTTTLQNCIPCAYAKNNRR